MAKLFLAIPIPNAAASALAGIQPPSAPGVRLVLPDQMHLTLCFIGESQIDPIAAAIRNVRIPKLILDIVGVGQFPSVAGSTMLWAGIRPDSALVSLHAALSNALTPLGFQPEHRPYRPHISLARCEPSVPAGLVATFLADRASLTLDRIVIDALSLYSSHFVAGIPVYHPEVTFPLS